MELSVNGTVRRTDAPGTTMLIRFLRDELGLKGARVGCGIGECGACTVLVDGSPIRSCITPISEVEGTETVTPEGLGGPDDPHPIQRAFLEEQAGQCGYCVNGMIMTIASLAGGTAGEEELREALDEHICRCGTHIRLLAAARRALGLPTTERRSSCRVAEEPGVSPAPEDAGGTGTAAALPPIVAAHPRIEQWIELDPDGCFVVRPGKVEIGQGIRTAFAQIVAAGLGVGLDHVRLGATETDLVPDERYTSGSESIEEGGTALAFASAGCRRVLLERAAARLGEPADALTIAEDGIVGRTGADRLSFTELRADGPVTGTIEPSDRPRWAGLPLGQRVARLDLPAKLTGAPGFLHDRTLDGMLSARAVLPPTPRATLVDAPVDDVRASPGVVDVLIDGRVVIVIAADDGAAVRAVDTLRQRLSWDHVPNESATSVEDLLRGLPYEALPVVQDPTAAEALDGAPTHAASYVGPYQVHGSVAPSAAIARFDGDALTVWSHTQGIYPLRRELATLLSMPEDSVRVIHDDGPGCYGMNGADDTAAFAAMAARAVSGRPVRFQFSVEDEFKWEPYGPAMVMDLAATLDDGGAIRAWRHHTISDVHKTRPNGRGDRLIASWLRADGTGDRPWPGPEEGGARNATPLYDVPALDVLVKYVRGPLRTSALRALGAYLNLFAAESFVDELAAIAGRDPLEFRLAHLADPRARTVLQTAAEQAGWEPHVGPSGRGMGVAVAHYKDNKAYVAQVAEVDLDRETGSFTVSRIVLACDAGVIVNPDGLRNQLEGGTLQGLGRALFEELHLAPEGTQERDWTTYDTLRFRHVPDVEIHLIARPDRPPLGVGEAATPVVPAAVANAIYDAVGIRLRRLPLTAAQMEQRLLEMDAEESSAVRL